MVGELVRSGGSAFTGRVRGGRRRFGEGGEVERVTGGGTREGSIAACE